jgi:hypothetical protein
VERPETTGKGGGSACKTSRAASNNRRVKAEVRRSRVSRAWRINPTDGVLAGLDHICVACGRNYRDATPTQGTIFKGGGGESLTTTVEVTVVRVTAEE